MYKFNTKVYKMGNKLGLYLNKSFLSQLNLEKGDYVKLKIGNIETNTEFISKLNYNIVLRNKTIKLLKLEPNDEITVFIDKLVDLKRPKKIFRQHKIDLLALIPENTFSGYKIFVYQFVRNSEKWLRIWYAHERGSARELELKRYIDIRPFGSLLGQLQAEGDKFIGRRKHRVSFGNNLLTEHQEFIESILLSGINPEDVEFLCTYNPNRFDKVKVEKEAIDLVEELDISNIKFRSKANDRIWCNFKTTIRRSILSEILLHSMNKIRKSLIKNRLSTDIKTFAYEFIAKLLTGDGTIDINKRKEYDYPRVRIKIIDQNLEYLEDYCKILQKFGFSTKVKEKEISVRASCSLENLLFLYKINAFKNSNNWNKLIIVVGMLLSGYHLKVKKRFSSLVNLDPFTSLDVRRLFNLERRTTQDWIGNLRKDGFIELVDKTDRPYKYSLTPKAREYAYLISQISDELDKLVKTQSTNNLWSLLDMFKVKNKSI